MPARTVRKLSLEELLALGISEETAQRAVELQAQPKDRAIYYRVQVTAEQLAELEESFPELKFIRLHGGK